MGSREQLANGILPDRYLRNAGTIGLDGQRKLCNARVAIVGAGGLGGLVVELLARVGVGFLRVIDGDSFVCHNLNRQLLAEEGKMDCNKAIAAARRIAAVNSEVTVEACPWMLTAENAESLLSDVDLVVDALDSIPTRLLLAAAARRSRIALIHGAIAGCTGQVMTVLPDDPGLEWLYRNPAATGVENELGNPAATPALAASLQVQEAVKLITGRGELLRNKLLYFDTEWNIFEIVEVQTK